MSYQKIPESQHKKPAPRSKDINPLHGNSTMSKIDHYQLGDIVRKLRESGCSLNEIQTEINTKYLTEENSFVSIMSLSRWINKNIDNSKDLDKRNSSYSIDEYQEYIEMLEYCNTQLEIAEVAMTDLKKSAKASGTFVNAKDVTNLINSTQKMIAQKQAILAAIIVVKEKIYSFQAMNEIITIVTDKVKARDMTLYSEIISDIKNDPMLIAAYQKIRCIQK